MRALLVLSLAVALGSSCATTAATQSSHKTASRTVKHRHPTTAKAPSDVASDADEATPGDEGDGSGDDLTAVAASEGGASFYHDSLAGRTTANGEKYDPDEATCAHRTLPFGTLLVIEDVATGKKARCRVNDRGPYADGRILDVSKRVAKDLGMIDRGVTR